MLERIATRAAHLAVESAPALIEELTVAMASGLGKGSTKFVAGALEAELKQAGKSTMLRFEGHSALHEGPEGINLVGHKGHQLTLNNDRFHLALPNGTKIGYSDQAVVTKFPHGDVVVQRRVDENTIDTLLNGRSLPKETSIRLKDGSRVETNSATNSNLMLSDGTQVSHYWSHLKVNTGASHLQPGRLREHEINLGRDYDRGYEVPTALSLKDVRSGAAVKNYYDKPTFVTQSNGHLMVRKLDQRSGEWFQSLDLSLGR